MEYGHSPYKLIFLTLLTLVSIQVQAFSESELFPFDQRHLTYKDFKADLDEISQFVTSRCSSTGSQVSERMKVDLEQGCTFPQLLLELKSATEQANQDFATQELETRTHAQFIDVEYGWVLRRTPFSLSNKSHQSLLRLILVKAAMQMAVDHLSSVWLKTDLHGSNMGRLYIIPKFSAGLERDVILARTMRYASAIRCHSGPPQTEEACIQIRSALVLPLNEILNEFQAIHIAPEPEIQDYVRASDEFRAKLKAWLATHNSPTLILKSLKENPQDLVELDQIYSALIDLPKRIRAPEINVMAARFNIHRYVDELKPIDPIFTDYLTKNEPTLTPEIISILAKIRKQLSIYYQTNSI